MTSRHDMTSRRLEVVAVNVSEERGTAKRPVDSIVVDEQGIVGDSHAGAWHRQVSLLGLESIERFAERAGMRFRGDTGETPVPPSVAPPDTGETPVPPSVAPPDTGETLVPPSVAPPDTGETPVPPGRELGPGSFAENLTVRGLDCAGVSLLDRFRINEVELEVTQIGKACHGQGCAIFERVGRCVMPDEGIFTRVVQGGTIRPGDAMEFLPKTWRFRVITLSDRASRGEYEDHSGPRVRELLEDYLEAGRRRGEVESVLLSDDPAEFRAALEAARAAGVEVVISTGGTGVGPRDRAPETVTAFCDRLVPGIPEAIRAKFGAAYPNAYLSRAVVGLAGTMVVYMLPGSVRAVEEYMGEILLTMQHLLLMVRGIDAH